MLALGGIDPGPVVGDPHDDARPVSPASVTSTGFPAAYRFELSNRFASARSSCAASAQTDGSAGSALTLKLVSPSGMRSSAESTISSTEHEIRCGTATPPSRRDMSRSFSTRLDSRPPRL